MYIYIIVACIVFIYGAFSTIFHSTDMVGNIGRTYGETNLNLFGYLAYIDLLLFLYPLYKLYYNRNLIKKMDFYVGWMILFISLILLESLILEFNNVGSVGITLRLFLLPYIGKAGLWLLWLLTFLVSLVLLLDDIPDLYFLRKKMALIEDIISKYRKTILSNLSKFKNPFFDKRSTEIMATIVSKGVIVEDRPKSNSHTIAHDRLKKITNRGKNSSSSRKKIEDKKGEKRGRRRTVRKRKITPKVNKE